MRQISAEGLRLTKDSEGFVDQLYNDAAGYCTIGYGHLIKRSLCDGSEPQEFCEGYQKPRERAAFRRYAVLTVSSDGSRNEGIK